ncbi:MAG: hypothetical protein AUI16_25010 [Alphaproteobacteria bacterium 13_2_20CM_2_64_7]|nr:MAG: hypothetical protein AUI16_25010 [Alphaproteobacteria bacterium 13_2_20CM_2_64_7]
MLDPDDLRAGRFSDVVAPRVGQAPGAQNLGLFGQCMPRWLEAVSRIRAASARGFELRIGPPLGSEQAVKIVND